MFLRFLNGTHGTKSRKALHITPKKYIKYIKIYKNIQEYIKPKVLQEIGQTNNITGY